MRALCILLAAFTLSSDVAQEKTAAQTPPVYSVDAVALHREIAKSKGKVVLVNVWATWCVPCVEEFPDLLKLRNNYERRGLEMLFVSTDNPKRLRQDVYPFLQKMKVAFPTFIKRPKDDEAFINALSPNWSGALPATFIFDRSGKLIHTLIDVQTFKELSNIVEPLLESAP
jgi:thiol-disulfide isomerase/thioredoxin